MKKIKKKNKSNRVKKRVNKIKKGKTRGQK